ncbi:MAG: hypothetical protein HQK55_09600, partial [Deltaproteobacteria bacterium]|nr:hypothetical protein [Deltaproteobacteria bacterium]
LKHFWATIKSPLGVFDVGRMPGHGSRLADLGWTGSDLGYTEPFGNAYEQFADRISYTYTSGPISLNAYYEKKMENDAGNGEGALNLGTRNTVADSGARFYDKDWDEIAVTPTYKFANGGASMTLAYDQMKAPNAMNMGNWWDWPNWGPRMYPFSSLASLVALTPAGTNIGNVPSGVQGYYWMFNPAVVLNFGPVGIHGEMMWKTGGVKWKNSPGKTGTTDPVTGKEIKDNATLSGFGLYIDATYKFGPGIVGLSYTYVSGDKTVTDYNFNGMVDSGGDFAPLLITFDRWINPWRDHSMAGAGVGAATSPLTGGTGFPTATTIVGGDSNFWMLEAWADYNVTEDLMLHTALGYMQVNETGRNPWAGGRANTATGFVGRNIDKNFGTEFNVSGKYQIMKNLSYKLELGYFWAGNYFKQGWDSSDPAIAGTPYTNLAKIGNAYAIKNTLTLKF